MTRDEVQGVVPGLLSAVQQSIAGRDLAAALANFAPDAVVIVRGAPHVPFVGVFRGRSEIESFFAHLTTNEVVDLAVEQLLFGDDTAVALGHYEYRVPSANTGYAGDFALRVEVSAGLVTRWQMYEDSWAVASAYAPQGTDDARS